VLNTLQLFLTQTAVVVDALLCAAEAGRILESEAHLLDMPQPLPTIEQLDHRRNIMKLSKL